MQTQKQWQILERGVESLTLVENAPIPLPSDYDIVIQIFSAGLNPVDWKRCDRFQKPGCVGLDSVGVIYSKGSLVSEEFVTGVTLVCCFGSLARQNEQGSLAQYTIADSRYVVIVPQSLIQKYEVKKILYSSLAASITTGFTAYQVVFSRLKLLPNKIHHPFKKNIMVTCGSGGVGAFCLQLLNYYKNTLPNEYKNQLKLITTCSARNFDYVKSLGATHCIDYNSQDIESECQSLTNGVGMDAWIDLVDENSAELGLKCLAFNGELVVVVKNADYTNKLFMKAISVHNVSTGYIYYSENHDQILELKRLGDHFISLVNDGYIQPIKYKEISIEEVKEGLLSIKANKAGIKLVMINQ